MYGNRNKERGYLLISAYSISEKPKVRVELLNSLNASISQDVLLVNIEDIKEYINSTAQNIDSIKVKVKEVKENILFNITKESLKISVETDNIINSYACLYNPKLEVKADSVYSIKLSVLSNNYFKVICSQILTDEHNNYEIFIVTEGDFIFSDGETFKVNKDGI